MRVPAARGRRLMRTACSMTTGTKSRPHTLSEIVRVYSPRPRCVIHHSCELGGMAPRDEMAVYSLCIRTRPRPGRARAASAAAPSASRSRLSPGVNDLRFLFFCFLLRALALTGTI